MRKWTYDEVLLALYAYCHVPFNKASNTNPWIVNIANAIDRSPAAVKMKIGNLGVYDPYLKSKGIGGLTKTSKIDELVWNDYYGRWDKLVDDAEKLLTSKGFGTRDDLLDLPVGSEEYCAAKRRINQNFFRDVILTSYRKCCISGIKEPSLLEAAHIIGWTENESLRTNPSNGLCLSPFFHEAFDKFFITISVDYKIIMSDRLISSVDDEKTLHYLLGLQKQNIILPNRFLPDTQYLSLHNEKYRANN